MSTSWREIPITTPVPVLRQIYEQALQDLLRFKYVIECMEGVARYPQALSDCETKEEIVHGMRHLHEAIRRKEIDEMTEAFERENPPPEPRQIEPAIRLISHPVKVIAALFELPIDDRTVRALARRLDRHALAGNSDCRRQNDDRGLREPMWRYYITEDVERIVNEFKASLDSGASR